MQFKADAGNTKWEFHYAFPDTAAHYVVQPSGFVGELFFHLQIVRLPADTTYDEWTVQAFAETSKPPHQKHYTGSRQLLLKPGKMIVSLLVRDMNDSSRSITSTFESTVRDYGLQVDMSDIMFTLPEVQAQSGFTRNGVSAVPNPRHEMVGTDPSISIYGEIYNAKVNRLDTFVIEYSVLDYIRTEMMTTYGKMVAVDDALLFREDLPAGLLRSGVYTLSVAVKPLDLSSTLAVREGRFYILNPEPPPEGEILLGEEEMFFSSEWAAKTGDALDHEIELARVIASNAEQSVMDELETDRAKQRFLFKFWITRDPDASTQANERLDEFRSMYQRAQTFYTSAMTRDGWKTDRGITLLRYGRPTQVEQYIQTLDTKPYEVWFYQGIQGGAFFYFVDWQLLQNHKLVHSTVIGEVRDEKWFDRWARAFTTDMNPLHEQLPSSR